MLTNNISEKISKVILFDTRQYSLSFNSSCNNLFAPVYKEFRRLINDFTHLNNAEFFIFFRCNPHYDIPSPWNDKINNIHFIPVNAPCFGPSAFIPTQWVQDVLYFAEDKDKNIKQIICNPSRISKALLKVLKATFQKLGYEVCHSTGETPDAGGNWQRFEINRKIITVAGRPSVSDGPPLPQKPDDLPPIHIWDEKLCPFADNFFHLDNYFQWIGNMDNAIASKAEPNEGYYFLASQSHYPEDFPHPGNGALDKAIHKAVNLFNEQVCQLGASPMAIPLPVMLFPMGSPVKGGPEEACNDIYHFLSMSYVNCIVENYMTDTGWRIVNVYLPDFRESLEEIHRQSINQNIPLTQSDFRKGISPLWEVVYGEQLADDKITKESLENFIYSVQHKIAAGLYRLGFTNVCFVRHRFHALSHKRGALHCITKIV